MWFIWKSRSEMVFDNNGKPARDIYYRVMHYCHNSKIHLHPTEASGSNTSNLGLTNRSMHIHWTRPPESWVKINIDASVIKDSFIAGLTLIIRYFTGTLVRERILVVRSMYVEQAEAMVMLEAVKWAYNLHLQQVITESDNMVVVQGVKGNEAAVMWENQGKVKGPLEFVPCETPLKS
ncbi:uncharacterized protein LOC113296593 [Papaver somniferum]|uniref:uncharacterized protein LOC113296593 n=1 Tax=Papaver somniferum TaxID=3469 RepID=UPI000E6FF2A8|nr:uncharacterized protein LOC113296593 [Papaver somniferum]